MQKWKWLVIPAVVFGVYCSTLFFDRSDSPEANPEVAVETEEAIDPARELVCGDVMQTEGKKILSERVYEHLDSEYRQYPFDILELEYSPPESFYEPPLNNPDNEVYFVSVSALKLPNNHFHGGGGCYLVALRRADCTVVDIRQDGCPHD